MGQLADSADQVLGDFVRVASACGIECVVIGAGARVLWCLTREIDPGRLTHDWDLAVSVDDWSGFEQLVLGLTAGADAPFRTTSVKHRLIHNGTDLPLDIVPFGGVETDPGKIVWSGGATMDVTGLATSLEDHESASVGQQSIPFASLRAQSVMKAISYLDRRDRGTNHDVIDFVWVLRNYGEGEDDARVFDDVSDVIIANEVESHAYGALLLGHDLREYPADLLGPVRTVLGGLITEMSAAVRDVRPSTSSVFADRPDMEVHQLAQAVLWGLDH